MIKSCYGIELYECVPLSKNKAKQTKKQFPEEKKTDYSNVDVVNELHLVFYCLLYRELCQNIAEYLEKAWTQKVPSHEAFRTFLFPLCVEGLGSLW